MWPFERLRRPHPVVRLGRQQAELWEFGREFDGEGGGHRLSVQPLSEHATPTLEAVCAAILPLLQDLHARATLVVESAWLPVTLIDTGGRLLSAPQLDALARHRLSIFGDLPEDPVSGWDVRVDHRAGHRYALVYGLPARLKQTMLALSEERRVPWNALCPALDWVLQRPAPQSAGSGRSGWRWLCEQDRSILVRVQGGRIMGLNAALAPRAAGATVILPIRAEAVRWGVDDVDPSSVVATSWEPIASLARSEDGVCWSPLGLESRSVGATAPAELPRAEVA